ncbi:AIPR family protein [Mesorhizobium atlanticum]|uniref:Abortive phage infection protein n=1 Tax=Mesorhizobium atlanticum TaxID=2233532 RepID=A0A330GVU9_9HYPH|nr:AIPR family protein [Mesorhizobium atlanticum]RAZ78630.1 abortive phage infection protein [Mesorhizobium atlanticum]
MATLLDFNTLSHKVSEWLDPSAGFETPSRAFAALMVGTVLSVSDEEAYDAIVDGGNDRGIDGVYVDQRDGDNTIHLFQFKYTTSFEKTKNNFPGGEIDKVLSFLSDVLDKDFKLKQTSNPLLWDKVQEIWDALDKKGPRIEVHFCGNMLPLTLLDKKRVDDAFAKYRYVRAVGHSLEEIVQFFVEADKPLIDRDIYVVDKDYFERTDGKARALICSVDAKQIVKMITDPNDETKVYTPIFDENVRIYQSHLNPINREIIATALSEDRFFFWYLNNGLTITCSSFSYAKGSRGPLVSLQNVQIVNGGQTSNALFEANRQDADKLDDVLVLVRIIEAKADDIGQKVSETTNSQTPIKSRDLRANTAVQRKIEQALRANGLFYERKKDQYRSVDRQKRIDALLAGQAYLAYGLDMPEIAKKDRGRTFGDLFDTVFSEDLDPLNLITPVRVLEEIERRKKAIQKSIREKLPVDPDHLFIIDGAYHVLFSVKRLCVNDSSDPFDVTNALSKVDLAFEITKNLVRNEKSIDPLFSLNRFFKDAGTRTKIESAIVSGNYL